MVASGLLKQTILALDYDYHHSVMADDEERRR